MIDWDKLTREDAELIRDIVKRGKKLCITADHDHQSIVMDITAAHLDVGLDLPGLLKATPFNFSHDVAGIVNHMDRETGKLTDCFLPRYARGELAPK